MVESYKKELSASLVDSFASRIINAIDIENKKVIVVAHSQGNLYLNEVILRVLGTRPDLKDKMDRYFATVYVASPAYAISGVNSSSIKLNDDKVTGWMGDPALYDVVSSHPFWYFYHGFSDIYLRDDIFVEGNYSMRDLFLKALYDKARSFYANCCRDSYGERVSRGALHLNGMGWVSNPNKVPSLFTVDKTAEICGDVSITGAGRISELVHIRGNGEIKNFQAGPIDFKHPDKYLGFTKGVEVPRFETPMILIEDSDIENSGIWVEDIESINPTVSPMGIIRSSVVKNSGTLRNAIIDNGSTVDGPISITESKVDSSTAKSSQAPQSQDSDKYYISKSTVEDGAEVSDSIVTNGSVISQAKISNNSVIVKGNLSGDTVIDDSTVVDAFLTNVHLLNTAYGGGNAKKLNITSSIIVDGDITEGELRCSVVMDSILTKSTIINSIIDGEYFVSESKTNNICPNLNTFPDPDTCKEPQELDECVGNPKTKSKLFLSNLQNKNIRKLLILNKGKNILNLF